MAKGKGKKGPNNGLLGQKGLLGGGKGGKGAFPSLEDSAYEALTDEPEPPELQGAEPLGQFVGVIQDLETLGVIQCDELQAQGFQGVSVHRAEAAHRGFQVGSEVVFTAVLDAMGQPHAKDLRVPGPATKRLRT